MNLVVRLFGREVLAISTSLPGGTSIEATTGEWLSTDYPDHGQLGFVLPSTEE